ncbi:MAG: ParB/RepB/Spo0J family partition protein [Fluviibacter phosphoraccumulans]
MFDLSQFDASPVFAPENQIGIVLSLPLECVTEDPTQPRTEFDTDELVRLAEDIGRRGVQAPIAVRAPVEGVYQIIHGARRYRASRLAGLPTVPAIVQVDEVAFDDYSQVLENTQRDNLTPLDIARFIQKRKALGESNSQIARSLSEKPEWVTYHLALIDMPPDIQQAYDAGQIKGAKTIYELRKLHGKASEKVKKLVESGEEITRGLISEANKPIKSGLNAPTGAPVQIRTQPVAPNHFKSADINDTYKQEQISEVDGFSLNPKILVSPCVTGIYQGNQVQILIQLKPSEPGYAWIRTTGSSGQEEVLANQITLSRIEENHP